MLTATAYFTTSQVELRFTLKGDRDGRYYSITRIVPRQATCKLPLQGLVSGTAEGMFRVITASVGKQYPKAYKLLVKWLKSMDYKSHGWDYTLAIPTEGDPDAR